jgi:hypothetical protein
MLFVLLETITASAIGRVTADNPTETSRGIDAEINL